MIHLEPLSIRPPPLHKMVNMQKSLLLWEGAAVFWRVTADRFPRDVSGESGGGGAGLFLSFRRRHTTNIPSCAANHVSVQFFRTSTQACTKIKKSMKLLPMSVFTLLLALFSSPRGERTKQRYGERAGTKITLYRTITVVKPCCRLMCCDNGDKERLRIDPSEWAAEERELCVITHETFCRWRY